MGGEVITTLEIGLRLGKGLAGTKCVPFLQRDRRVLNYKDGER